MLMTILKAVGTVAVVVIISEVQKRSNVLAAAIAALPLMTMLVVFNLATDEKAGPAQATQFANTTFLLFFPGLTFFIPCRWRRRWACRSGGRSAWPPRPPSSSLSPRLA